MNKLRAELIYKEYGNGECDILAVNILERFLKGHPSITETTACKNKGCVTKNRELKLAVLTICGIEFDNNLNNLQKAVLATLPEESICQKCRKPCESLQRECGQHLFIEVLM